MIRQGDVYWVDLGGPSISGHAAMRPYVVVQNDLFNQSKINSVVGCELTSNLPRAAAPGNVLLEKDEADLPRRGVVNVSQIHTVQKEDLVEKDRGSFKRPARPDTRGNRPGAATPPGHAAIRPRHRLAVYASMAFSMSITVCRATVSDSGLTWSIVS